jgi:hypothetical protein
LVVTTLLHMALAAALPLSGDEAYYWDCSRHPDWSYFDQPPLVIWGMIPFRAVLGETTLAVRMPAIVASLAIGLLLVPIARRFGGGYREAAAALVILHLTPAFFAGSFYASTDIGMIACYAAATVAAAAVAEGDARGWWGFGLAIGLGFLAKFPAVLALAAIGAALVASAAARAHLRRPTPWVAALVSAAVTAPVWIWGALHRWDNIRFQLAGRHTADPEPLQQILDLVLGVLAMLTPFLAVAMVVAWFRSRRADDPGRFVIRAAAAVPAVVFGALAVRTEIAPHWVLPGVVPAAAMLATTEFRWRRGLVVAGGVMGIALSLAMVAIVRSPERLLGVEWSYAGQPRRISTSALSALIGTDDIVREVERRLRPGELVASESYSVVHEFAFRSKGRLPTRLANVNRGSHGLASLYWFAPDDLVGSDVLFVTKREGFDDRLAELFAEVVEEPPIVVRLDGEPVRRMRVLRCRDLRRPDGGFSALGWRSPPPPELTPATAP